MIAPARAPMSLDRCIGSRAETTPRLRDRQRGPRPGTRSSADFGLLYPCRVTVLSDRPPGTRVALIGAESTGKTTLARALAEELGAPWVPEYAREYLARRGPPLTSEDVEPIARGQMAGEDEGRRRGGLLILDTDLVSTVVYARYYYGRCPMWIEDAARERRAHLYLLLHPDVPWVEDGAQRDRPYAREELHGRFRAALAAISARVVEVRGPWATRAETARGAVDDLLRAGTTAF
jgi:nicotinamide riboside kinase